MSETPQTRISIKQVKYILDHWRMKQFVLQHNTTISPSTKAMKIKSANTRCREEQYDKVPTRWPWEILDPRPELHRVLSSFPQSSSYLSTSSQFSLYPPCQFSKPSTYSALWKTYTSIQSPYRIITHFPNQLCKFISAHLKTITSHLISSQTHKIRLPYVSAPSPMTQYTYKSNQFPFPMNVEPHPISLCSILHIPLSHPSLFPSAE